jgi:hypothetical protein
MRFLKRSKPRKTDGERARALAFLLVGLSSSALGFLAVLHLDRSALFPGLGLYQIWVIVASGLGRLVALFLSGDRLGQTGPRGNLRAISGGLGHLCWRINRGHIRLAVLWHNVRPVYRQRDLRQRAVVDVPLDTQFFGAHMLLKIYQTERDSIFASAKMTVPVHPNSLRMRLRRQFI